VFEPVVQAASNFLIVSVAIRSIVSTADQKRQQEISWATQEILQVSGAAQKVCIRLHTLPRVEA
jgi:hypothetical protein